MRTEFSDINYYFIHICNSILYPSFVLMKYAQFDFSWLILAFYFRFKSTFGACDERFHNGKNLIFGQANSVF